MELTKDTFEAISKQAVEAASLKPVKVDAEPAHVYWLRNAAGGGLQHIEADPAPRAHAALSLETICAFAKSNKNSAVWYSRTGVVCLTDDTTRRDRVSLGLSYSAPLRRLQELEATGSVIQHKQLIFMLRTTFANCLAQAGTLLDILRSIRWKNSADGSSTIAHGKASIGKQIEQSIEGLDAIPEYVTLSVPIFHSNVIARLFSVRCALEPDPATQSFQLIPLPREIELAIAGAEDAIQEELLQGLTVGVAETSDPSQLAAPLYYGTP